ncbi:MAG: class I SAM-dependent methyltransferase [Thermoleophilaceae bacterium]
MSEPPAETRDASRFANLTFADFRRMALDESLSPHEKVGFPDAYRAGAAEAILADIVSKLPALTERGRRVVDVGPGCSDLSHRLLDLCAERGHEAVLVDSEEMLAQLPDRQGIVKVAGAFPHDAEMPPGIDGTVDAVVVYSVLQYVHAEADSAAFLDRALALLAHGGRMLVGDIPNSSKRARFFASPAGREFHRGFTGSDDPRPAGDGGASGGIDDAAVLGVLDRARRAGFDAYVVAQAPELPMANRREDILVVRP